MEYAEEGGFVRRISEQIIVIQFFGKAVENRQAKSAPTIKRKSSRRPPNLDQSLASRIVRSFLDPAYGAVLSTDSRGRFACQVNDNQRMPVPQNVNHGAHDNGKRFQERAALRAQLDTGQRLQRPNRRRLFYGV